MASWRALGGAAVVAIAATGIVAGVVQAQPAGVAPAVGTSAAPGAANAPATTQALGLVTEHPLDSAALAALQHAAPTQGQTVVQEVRLSVIGGAIELVTTSAAVTLERVPGTRSEWVGVLPPVRVVDARGTHEGWEVRWTVDSVEVGADERRVPAAKVQVEPGAAVVVAGVADGLEPGKAGPAVRHGRTLFRAEEGGGGGTYEAGGTVRLRLPASVDAETVVVHLSFHLA